MKTGQSLQQIATEIERQKAAKKDYLAPTKQLVLGDDGAALRVNGKGSFEMTEIAHGQLATHVGVPRAYYDKMRVEAPALLGTNVNHWLARNSETRLVRTLDGRARAILSRRYRPLDYDDMAEAVLPAIIGAGCRIESAALTSSRLYIKAVTANITAEVVPGDVVQAGIVISNSEVGFGSVRVEPLVYRLVCRNGMIASDLSLNKYHVGRSGGVGDLAEEFFRDETRQADDKAFWMKVQDVVKGALSRDVFAKIAARLQSATKNAIVEAQVEEVVKRAQERFQLSQQERSGVLAHLIRGGDLTQYGLVQAITRTSQDVEEYDRATDLERLGGQVLELPASDWTALAGG
jgi:hypothetical protein